MAEKLFPLHYRTLGALYDAGLHLHAFCCNPDCRWSVDLDLEDMIGRLGRRFGSMPADLVPVLVCSKCQGKDIAVTLAASDAPIPENVADEIRRDWQTRT